MGVRAATALPLQWTPSQKPRDSTCGQDSLQFTNRPERAAAALPAHTQNILAYTLSLQQATAKPCDAPPLSSDYDCECKSQHYCSVVAMRIINTSSMTVPMNTLHQALRCPGMAQLNMPVPTATPTDGVRMRPRAYA